ncbi:hypothetical protein FJT64_018496 [Amphibalanus amphitrite]|uniref:Uncharacterized protein n=1 Tax=Amphibalanus amphitrite TaxID=1232801 RepID=A0A6A4X3C5_AMPAM|nr:hypothetical protein FJT64_018496 [Amphibalanus amphitrite]
MDARKQFNSAAEPARRRRPRRRQDNGALAAFILHLMQIENRRNCELPYYRTHRRVAGMVHDRTRYNSMELASGSTSERNADTDGAVADNTNGSEDVSANRPAETSMGQEAEEVSHNFMVESMNCNDSKTRTCYSV